MPERYMQKIAATIADGYSESSAINVASFKFVSVELPTASIGLASSTVTVYLKGSDASDGTFRTLAINDVSSSASATTGNITVSADMNLLPYIKVCLSLNTATAAAFAAVVHCYY